MYPPRRLKSGKKKKNNFITLGIVPAIRPQGVVKIVITRVIAFEGAQVLLSDTSEPFSIEKEIEQPYQNSPFWVV